MAERSERAEIMQGIEDLDRRFREEQERHGAVTAALRDELQLLLQRADAASLSVSSLAKALSISRGRLNRMLDELR